MKYSAQHFSSNRSKKTAECDLCPHSKLSYLFQIKIYDVTETFFADFSVVLRSKTCLNPGDGSLKGNLSIDTLLSPPLLHFAGQSLQTIFANFKMEVE